MRCEAISRTASPWSWIPTLYIAEGLPYFAVNVLTVVMFTNMGIGKAEMAFFTGWLYLPWVIKPFWSPFVDIIKTKRMWVLAMQYGIAASMAAVAFVLPRSFWFSTSLALFWLMAFFSATHDIAADGYYMLELDEKRQAAYVGVRSLFYRVASVLGQGGLLILAGWLEIHTGHVPTAWSLVFVTVSLLFFAISIYHTVFLPRPLSDVPGSDHSAREILKGFCDTFVTFVKKPGIGTAVLFILLYRFPEAMCLKIVPAFLLAPLDEGGLGLNTAEVGFANGTVGVVGLLLGGILGGVVIARDGLEKWLWPMAGALTLPCVFYCFLAQLQPEHLFWVNAAIGVEQFGYGFGFTAFMMYMMYFAAGQQKTSHYAFCTGLMALGMMVPGMAAGWVFEQLEMWNPLAFEGTHGYLTFFWWIMLSCVATFFVVWKVKAQRRSDI